MLISSSKVKANKYSKLIDTKLIDALLSKKKKFWFSFRATKFKLNYFPV